MQIPIYWLIVEAAAIVLVLHLFHDAEIFHLKCELLDHRRLLARARTVLDSLACLTCSSQGIDLGPNCCKDIDCDAGFYGIDSINTTKVILAIDAVIPRENGEEIH